MEIRIGGSGPVPPKQREHDVGPKRRAGGRPEDVVENGRGVGGAWNPDGNRQDREQYHTMAARGYWQAYRAVQESIGKVLKGQNPGDVAREDHRAGTGEFFAPSVVAGLLRPADLAGYRSGPVFIRESKHVPMNRPLRRRAWARTSSARHVRPRSQQDGRGHEAVADETPRRRPDTALHPTGAVRRCAPLD